MPDKWKSAKGHKHSGSRTVPFIGLEEAMSKSRTLFQKTKRNAIRVPTAASYLGYSPKASSAGMVLGALKKFGLLEDEGARDGRQVRLTERAVQILADVRETSPERSARIREAALLPKPFRELWDHYGSDLPDDKTIQTFLMLDKGYDEETVKLLIRVYRATITYAGLDVENTAREGLSNEASGGAAVIHEDFADDLNKELTRTVPAQFSSRANSASVRALSIPLERDRTFDFGFPIDLNIDEFNFVLDNLRLWGPKIARRAPG